MYKNFAKWNLLKEKHHNYRSRPFFHEREIWWCSIGINIGYEQDGKGAISSRPVLILKKFNKEIFWGIPLSTKQKTGKFYFDVILGDGIRRVAILSQLRLFDGKRLLNKIGTVNLKEFNKIQKAVIDLLYQ